MTEAIQANLASSEFDPSKPLLQQVVDIAMQEVRANVRTIESDEDYTIYL